MELYLHLRAREAEGRPIRVGIVGCGQMGSGLAHVMNQMTGMIPAALSDIDLDRPLATLKAMNVPESKIRVTTKLEKAEDALRAGDYVVTEDALLLTKLESLEAVVEATGLTEVGAQVAWNCAMNSKHVVMLNVETDVTVGPLLHRLACKSGSVYTVAFGDEPGVIKMLYDHVTSLGFEVVCAGKGKNNVIDFDATPDSCREEAISRGMNPKMLAAFKDGSKTMVEMAAVSNATGLVPDVPGMHGLQVDVPDLNKAFIPKEDGGIFTHRGCVEYSTGKVAPGVFVIITTEDPRIRTDLHFVAMGDGPYYTLYRPYHLCNIETPISVAKAVFHGEKTLVSERLVSEVVSIAKRNLKAGETVGEVGGPEYFNRIYIYTEARAKRGIPMGLAPGGKVLKDIAKGEMLTFDNFAMDTTRFAYKLRQIQDASLAGESG